MINQDINTFDMDKTLNETMFSIIVVVICCALVILMIANLVLTLYNYISFFYFTVKDTLIKLDESNVQNMRFADIYDSKLYNYVYCNDPRIVAKPDCDESSSQYILKTIEQILVPHDECDYDTKLYIHTINKLLNVSMNIIYIIIIIVLIQLLVYLVVAVFLGGMRKYKILGKNLISYIYAKDNVFIFIIILIIAYCIGHSIFFKFLFMDHVYSRIYSNYEQYRKIDLILNTEVKETATDKTFLELLQNTTSVNIDITFEEGNANKKILENIIKSENKDIRASKLFVYALYIFIIHRNKKDGQPLDTEIVKKIHDIAIQTPNKPFSIRYLIDLQVLNDTQSDIHDDIKGELNRIVNTLITKTSNNKWADGTDKLQTLDGNNINDLTTKLNTKINNFFETLKNAENNLDYENVIYFLNWYIVFDLVMNLVFTLLVLLVIYFFADDANPYFNLIKKGIMVVVGAIISAIGFFLDFISNAAGI